MTKKQFKSRLERALEEIVSLHMDNGVPSNSCLYIRLAECVAFLALAVNCADDYQEKR